MELSKEAQRALQVALEPDETIRAVVNGFAGSAIIVTDRRVHVFTRTPFTSGKLASWPVRAITGMKLVSGYLTVGVLGEIDPQSIVPVQGAEVAELQAAFLASQAQAPEGVPAIGGRIEGLLQGLTGGWMLGAVTRTYPGNDEGRKVFAAETQLLAAHGYRVTSQSQDGGHIHAGRLIATGGLSVLAGQGGTRAKGSITVTFEKVAAAPADGPMEQLKKLGELRDAGILTQAEFDSKKTEILQRL
jgi:hypothetical protein